MNVVVDTNVLVSGLLCPFSPSGDIVRMVSSGDISLCLDGRILSEYEDVLGRPKFRFDGEKVRILQDFICQNGQVCTAQPLPRPLPDHDDEAFMEVASAASAAYLVTGNISHFPVECRGKIRVVTPRQFVELWKSGS